MIIVLSIFCVGIGMINMGASEGSALFNFFVCILGMAAAVFHFITYKKANWVFRAGKYGLIAIAVLLLTFVQTGETGFVLLNAELADLDSAIEGEDVQIAKEQLASLTEEYGSIPGLTYRQCQLYFLDSSWSNVTRYAQDIPVGEDMMHYSAIIGTAMRRGNMQEAKNQALGAVSLFPWSYEAQYLAGITNFYSSDYDLAEQYFINATALDSKAEEPFYVLGWIAYLRRDSEAAEYFFKEALSRTKDPERTNDISELIAFAKSGEWYDGIEDEVSITDVKYSGDGANISFLSGANARIVPLRRRGKGRITNIPQKPRPKAPQKKDPKTDSPPPPVQKERPSWYDNGKYREERMRLHEEYKRRVEQHRKKWGNKKSEEARKTLETTLIVEQSLYEDRIKSLDEEWQSKMQTQPPTNVENVEKPNIYFYGTEGTQIAVSFERPDLLTNSIPDYGNGWTITQGPNGAIYDAFGEAYGYLFYESIADTFTFNKTKGFSLRGAVTEKERASDFRDILKLYGFNEAEICDFIEYWGSRLDLDIAYHMYPQTEKIDEVMPLVIAPTPDTVYRIWFGFAPASEDDLPPECPEIAPIVREGFTVVEWGGYVLD